MLNGKANTLITAAAITLASATVGRAQATTLYVPTNTDAMQTWQLAQSVGASKGKLYVVTVDKPNNRQSCRIQSFTLDKLVCSHVFGGSHTYLPQQVIALLIPGDRELKLRLVIGLNGGMAAAVWGTVVLAAACPACAVGTGIVALALFSAAGAILVGDDQPDRLLYLATGRRLSDKLGYIQHLKE